jgi:2-phosphosulfolactate phosphatase
MKISLLPSIDYINEEEVRGKVVIVIDVLRATTVITTAIFSGAREVLPVVEIDEAKSLKKEGDILAGERRGLKIEGFNLGNSPLEFTPDAVSGRRIITTTTNGTKAIHRALSADKIFIGSMINGISVAERAGQEKGDIVVICAGTYGKFSLDDFICAGKIIYNILDAQNYEMDDFALAAFLAYRENKQNIVSYVSSASHYRYLESIGLSEDLKYCFTEDIVNSVPQFKNGVIK